MPHERETAVCGDYNNNNNNSDGSNNNNDNNGAPSTKLSVSWLCAND